MVTSDFQRARRPEHKEQRREAILAAARLLATRDGVRSVTLGDIAGEVGVHKSALLRYFETREEIYLHLTAAGWRDWAAALHTALDGATGASTAEVAGTLAQSLHERPLFCDLLAHAPMTLERHVSLESVRAFKLSALDAVEDIAALLARVLPGLDSVSGRNVVATVTSLGATLWQASHPPDTLAQLYREDPRLGHAVVDFTPRLRLLTEAVLVGLLASADDA
ncbi:TetR/AcrR family transcriptional regulator [Amycolatopsis rhabdoformis]|uniref:TetR/AcrR family transcriptional regulator n=1 Tax=Amycolatopsis rhabdoformis TaxID=1448059 RepID=A0ABZ1IFJ8_9PSEU|nr:TetR/AcrR family transcriptional regulator [Amycolatopsis rhabdoformis]WSE32826.1 TetR/AcrR family transcriptional regulator [Amycolatopsis rhabdoformis]